MNRIFSHHLLGRERYTLELRQYGQLFRLTLRKMWTRDKAVFPGIIDHDVLSKTRAWLMPAN